MLSMSDANWGPQDATVTTSGSELPLFISRSMSAFYIDLLGPLQKDKKLLLRVLLRQKYMLLMNV